MQGQRIRRMVGMLQLKKLGQGTFPVVIKFYILLAEPCWQTSANDSRKIFITELDWLWNPNVRFLKQTLSSLSIDEVYKGNGRFGKNLASFLACFYWCLSLFCEVRVTKPAQASNKAKQTTTSKMHKLAQMHWKKKRLRNYRATPK